MMKFIKKILPIKMRWALSDVRRWIKRILFNVILFIEKQSVIIWSYLKGIYRYLFFFRIGRVYKNNYNHAYYKYTGGGIFLEGSKTIDYGTYAIEIHGYNVVFGIFAMGFFDWEEYK